MYNNNAPLSASKFQNPIYLETPRLRKFYETTLTSLDSCSPLLGSSKPLVLQNLLQSDYKCNTTLQRMNLSNAKLMKALMDPLAEIELNNSDGKTCIEDAEEIGVGLMGVGQEVKRKQESKYLQQIKESQQNTKKIFEIYHCGKNGGGTYTSKIKDFNENEKIECNDPYDQGMMSFDGDHSNSDLKNEVKKRMRKSNQQLKILKVEFDKNGFWGKDKITQVANITGLSESQVYKWCWDQKKKQGEPDCISITKKIFKSKYKSNKALQMKQQLEEAHNESSILKNLNMENVYSEPQTVSKRLSFE